MNANIRHHAKKLIFTMLVMAGLLSACNLENLLSGVEPKNAVQPPVQPDSGLPLASITFELTTLTQAPSKKITLEILDEITGLAFNPKRYPMDAVADQIYRVEVPIAIGSVVKYRYISLSNPTSIEYTAEGRQVRYRLFKVDGPGTVSDLGAGWTNLPYEGPTGRITGQIIDRETNSPLPSAMITAGGAQTLTASDGSFLLEGLPPGTHNMVVFALDGKFSTFQQGAIVAENATTPATIHVDLAKLVKVTFVAQLPAAEIKGLPLRLIGSTYALGNTFADLDGGMSVAASRAPVMSMIADDIYSVTLELPVGMDLHYKYSLGDGFWNAEHNTDGSFRIRQLIIPDEETTVTDIIDGWKAGTSAPVTFTVTVPTDTPAGDTVSIQFNPYGWTTPIPMWPLGNNQWLYVLYGPLDIFGDVQYRYCRNDLCGIADDKATHLVEAANQKFSASPKPQSFDDTITQWVNWTPAGESTTIIAPEITARGSEFMAGVEFSPRDNPLWQPYIKNGLQSVTGYSSNWVIMSPSWSYTSKNPPVIEPVTGRDPLWSDTIAMVKSAQSLNLKAGLFPRLRSDLLPDGVWYESVTDTGWWDAWFERYQKFAVNYADLAAQSQASILVLGGPDVTPALPDGTLLNGNASGVPASAMEKWDVILSTVRAHYAGKIGWALPYPFPPSPLPDWLTDVDVLYVLFTPPLTESTSFSQGELQKAFVRMLEEDIQPLSEEFDKPVIIAIDYPSADGAAYSCVELSGQCLSFDLFHQPSAVNEVVPLDLQEQLDIYNSALNAISSQDWIDGFITRGFFYPGALQDSSPSVHGKPAADVLWYWFPKLLGN